MLQNKNRNRRSGAPAGIIIDFEKQRRLRQRRNAGRTRSRWFTVGSRAAWVIALPTVAGAMLGTWLDAQWPSTFSWSLALMLVGAAIGCVTAWRFGKS